MIFDTSYLLNWHLDWYTQNDSEKHVKNKVLLTQDNKTYRLSMNEKKRILLNNIHGVDVDPQAVEVTKLSLLLKVVEDPGQLTMFEEGHILPDLGNNIKCGNSLIGMDYFEGQLMMDAAEVARVNPFDWKSEFPQIFKRGATSTGSGQGFDVVIGNPPYGASLDENSTRYLRNKFSQLANSDDTYEFFLVNSKNIMRSNGRLGMIIPASWLTSEKYFKSRHTLVSSFEPAIALALPFDVFEDAYIDTAIVVFAFSSSETNTMIHVFPKKEKLQKIPEGIGTLVNIEGIRADSLNRLTIMLSNENAPIFSKLKSTGISFGDWFEVQRGIQPYSRSKHTEQQIKSKFLHASQPLTEEYMSELQGNELARYWIDSVRKSYIRYCDEIASTRALKMFQDKRLVIRRLLTRKFRLQVSITSETMITTDNVLNAIPVNEKTNVDFALGILNSKLLSWLYVNTSMIAQKDDFPQVHLSALKNLPMPIANVTQQTQIVTLVERMLALHKNLVSAKTPQEKESVQRQVESTDGAIDKLVYELYGLSEEEIKIVEGK